MKRTWKIVAAAVCVCLLATVAFAAASGAGGQNDPLVTLSYLRGVFAPQVQQNVQQAVTDQQAQNKAALDSAVSEWDAKVQQAIRDAGVSGGGSVSYTSVTLQPGQILVVGEGCEVLLRSGSVSWTADGQQLMDTTSGSALASGAALSANHLYLAMGSGALTVPQSQPTQPSQPVQTTGTVTAGPLNVRATPGGSIVGLVYEGDVVTIRSAADGWYQISIGSLTGYVSADYIAVNQSANTGSGTPAAVSAATLMVRGIYQIQ